MAGDAYFDKVKFLAHFDEANGSTSFVDVFGHTSSRAGSPTTTTSSPKMGTGHLNANSSGYIAKFANKGNGDFNLSGQKFTYEFFANVGVLPSSTNTSHVWSGCWGASNSLRHWGVGAHYSGGARLGFLYGDGSSPAWNSAWNSNCFSTTGLLSTGTWYHVAVTYDGSYLRVYLDGTRVVNYNITNLNIASSETDLWLGNSTYGYYDEARLTVGVARYTGSSFTVQTENYPDYYTPFDGAITESLAVTDWRMTAIRADTGAMLDSVKSTDGTYSLKRGVGSSGYYGPIIIVGHPHFDGRWAPSTNYALGALIVPTDAVTKPYLYKCTTAGWSGLTEPTWTTTVNNTNSDGDAVWTCLAALPAPVAHGPFCIPW